MTQNGSGAVSLKRKINIGVLFAFIFAIVALCWSYGSPLTGSAFAAEKAKPAAKKEAAKEPTKEIAKEPAKEAAKAPAAGAGHAYAGIAKCKMCHKLQFESWSKTKHAGAGKTAVALPKDLVVDTEVAKVDEKSVTFVKTGETIDCLACHTTGYDQKTGVAAQEGVTCEGCHGAGADYAPMPIMKNREKAIAAGLTIPDEKTCARCHRDDNPFTKEKFDYDKRKGLVHDHKPKPTAK